MSGSIDNPMMDGPPINPLDTAMDKMGLTPAGVAPGSGQPIYKVLGDSKIPVSKRRGKLWKSRRDAGLKSISEIKKSWEENLSYYNQDQSQHREGDGSDGKSGSRYTSRRLNNRNSINENVVYANVRAAVPELYAKNPILDATAEPDRNPQMPGQAQEDDVNTRRARAVAKLTTALFRMKAKPGVNIKPLAKKAITLALLTNLAWFETGYVQKEMSSEQAYNDLDKLSKELAEAKTTEAIIAVEGKLMALEEKIEFLSPGGPWVRLRGPGEVIKDPNSQDPWLSDCAWVMIEDMLPTSYIKAVYASDATDENKEQFKSLYEPTHILTGDAKEESENFTIFASDGDHAKYGYGDAETFNDAKRTKVWYVWDKITRRMEMYHDKNWQWPIWVWDDPLKLDTFFPLTPLFFSESPNNRYAKAPVSYYLDQQDLLNEISDEAKRAIQWARGNIFFNANKIDRKDAEKIIKGESDGLVGLNLPDDVKVSDAVFSVAPPSTQFSQLFDKGPVYAAIDRIDASNEAMRGGQFKTNTTNQAIEYYSTMGNMRMDERLDAVEEALGDVGWKIGQLCLRFMPADMVQKIIKMPVADFWKPIDPLADYDAAAITCVGGSTQKLTSKARKKEALDVGQILSQFSKVAPASVLKATLTLFASAFDDMQFTKEDWDAILAEVEAQLAGPMVSQGNGPSADGAVASQDPAAGPQAEGMAAQGGDMLQTLTMVAQVLEQLPPEALQGIGMALAQGVPPTEILNKVMQDGAPASEPQAPI